MGFVVSAEVGSFVLVLCRGLGIGLAKVALRISMNGSQDFAAPMAHILVQGVGFSFLLLIWLEPQVLSYCRV